MLKVQLGYNERLKDKVDLREVIDLSRIESDDKEASELPYQPLESFERFLQEIGH